MSVGPFVSAARVSEDSGFIGQWVFGWRGFAGNTTGTNFADRCHSRVSCVNDIPAGPTCEINTALPAMSVGIFI
jgi:hypothetical protein